MKARLFILGLCLSSSLATAVPPAAKSDDNYPEAQLKEWTKEKADDEKEAKTYRSLGQVSIRDIIQFHMDGDQVLMDSPQINTKEKVSFTLKEIPGFGTFDIIKPNPDPKSPVLGLHLTHRDYSHPGETIQTEVLFPSMQIARDIESPTIAVNISFIQNPTDSDPHDRVRLNVDVSNPITGTKTADFRLSAASLPALRREHPTEVAKYLRPILHDLRAENLLADPAAQWQVFATAFTASPTLTKQLNDLIKRLDADSLTERRSASKDLQKLGAPAALVVMNLDRSRFSPEQNIALDSFIAPFSPLSAGEVERARSDPDFLIDCLTADDAQIRKLAFNQLVAVLGHPVSNYDPDAPAPQRNQAAESLRAKLFAPTSQPNQNS